MNKIKIKTQKKLLFIPFVNTSILAIWVFVNSKGIKGWRTFTFLYVIMGFVFSIPIVTLGKYISGILPEYKRLIIFLLYYIFSIIIFTLILMCQKKCGIEE